MSHVATRRSRRVDEGNDPRDLPSRRNAPYLSTPLLPHMTALRARVALLRTAAPDENKAGRGTKVEASLYQFCLLAYRTYRTPVLLLQLANTGVVFFLRNSL